MKNLQLKKHFLLISIGLLISYLIGYYLIESDENQLDFFTPKAFIFVGATGVFNVYVLYFVSEFLDRIFPWQTHIGTRLFVGVLIDFSLVSAISFLAFYGYHSLEISLNELGETYQQVFIKFAIVLLMVVLVYAIIYFALYSYIIYTNLQIEKVKQERKQIDLQLGALKNQLSPHFLFNSLNTISSLAYHNTDKAALFIRKLAVMYSYTLKSYHKTLISLAEELEFVNSYVFLLNTRFEDAFSIQVDLPKTILQSRIPPLTLQMLIENAVKHNSMSANQQLEIYLYFENNKICVQNTITQKPHHVSSFQIGLKNINARYLLLIKKGISTTVGASFIVKLPLIE